MLLAICAFQRVILFRVLPTFRHSHTFIKSQWKNFMNTFPFELEANRKCGVRSGPVLLHFLSNFPFDDERFVGSHFGFSPMWMVAGSAKHANEVICTYITLLLCNLVNHYVEEYW
jgi:hypothetical protein